MKALASYLADARARVDAVLASVSSGDGVVRYSLLGEGKRLRPTLVFASHEALRGSSNRYKSWEVVDPEKWVPDGYACIRVDSRGAGRSPGYLCHNNARETSDIYQCIEWAAKQPWCSGKVRMNCISYYASNQWRAASMQPPHLAAICVW